MISDFVTVVVPAYNAASYIKQTLESVFSQTYRNFEVIVVDDGSTDDTALIAQKFGDRIRYIRQPNQGLSAARNSAIKNARADVIALLDADDLWEPQFLEKMDRQNRDIGPSLPERRDGDGHHVQTIEEVFPEISSLLEL